MDFQKLIQDLLDAGMTQAQIGLQIGLKQPSVFDILSGATKSVRWDVGNKLIALHKKRAKKAA